MGELLWQRVYEVNVHVFLNGEATTPACTDKRCVVYYTTATQGHDKLMKSFFPQTAKVK